MRELEVDGVIGDLATVFFRRDGSWEDVRINKRASGPPLSLYSSVERAICVVSGRNKVPGLRAALRAGMMTDLIVDEPTAHDLVSREE